MAMRRQRVNFEAVTVSAAARLIQLRRAQTLSADELTWYLAELTDLDPITSCEDGRVLGRLASRYLARGGSPLPPASDSEPPQRVPHPPARAVPLR